MQAKSHQSEILQSLIYFKMFLWVIFLLVVYMSMKSHSSNAFNKKDPDCIVLSLSILIFFRMKYIER